jgi:hypothetical protein
MFDTEFLFERIGTGSIMSRAIAIVACTLAVSACSSWPTIEMPAFKSTPALDSVRVESDPPGADVKAATGATCRTPCTLGVPLSDGNITVALNGYVPQTVPVQVVGVGDNRPDSFNSSGPHMTPNPLVVELEPNPPPPPPPVAQKPKKPHVVAKKKPTLAQSAPPAPAPSNASPPPPPIAPWPTPR